MIYCILLFDQPVYSIPFTNAAINCSPRNRYSFAAAQHLIMVAASCAKECSICTCCPGVFKPFLVAGFFVHKYNPEILITDLMFELGF